jgi:hypothetical protein
VITVYVSTCIYSEGERESERASERGRESSTSPGDNCICEYMHACIRMQADERIALLFTCFHGTGSGVDEPVTLASNHV